MNQRAPVVTTIPERLGRYQVLGHLATGGMAEILLARLDGPGGFQKVVVLKRVLPHLARKNEFRRMFLDEARIVASLRHSNVVHVHELGRDGDELFLVMEYLDGENVARLTRRVASMGHTISSAVAAHIVANACAGLHAAHELSVDGVPQSLVHRDVSPQNLFITYDGGVKVLDFGVAKAVGRYTNTTTGQVKGKFAYMAPEQCLAEAIDRRTDIFALGIVLWEATTSQRLFARDNELLVFKAICEERIRAPSELIADYPPALEAIVMRALSRSPADRYATAAEMRRELLLAIRDFAPGALAEDELAGLMQYLFADRIAQKAELMRQVGAGVNVGTLEWLELDTGPGKELATAELDVPAQSGTRASVKAALPEFTEPKAKRRVWPYLLLVVLALTAGAFGFLFAFPQSSAPRPRQRAAAAAAQVRPTQAPQPTASDTPATIVVHAETIPSGASVFIEGELRGTTPLQLDLPRGDGALDARFSLDGYRDAIEHIPTDVNQRVRVQLVREPHGRRIVRTPHPAPVAPPPQPRPGFYRFD